MTSEFESEHCLRNMTDEFIMQLHLEDTMACHLFSQVPRQTLMVDYGWEPVNKPNRTVEEQELHTKAFNYSESIMKDPTNFGKCIMCLWLWRSKDKERD